MRAGPEGRAELVRLLEEAIRSLEHMDLRGANEALKRVNARAATPGMATVDGDPTGSRPSDAKDEGELADYH